MNLAYLCTTYLVDVEFLRFTMLGEIFSGEGMVGLYLKIGI